jgi:hypothetical protein
LGQFATASSVIRWTTSNSVPQEGQRYP